jgi:hypothetical protein
MGAELAVPGERQAYLLLEQPDQMEQHPVEVAVAVAQLKVVQVQVKAAMARQVVSVLRHGRY